MSESWQQPYPYPGYPEPAPPPATARPGTLADLRAAAAVAIGLAVVGALLGFVWSSWSGLQQRAYVVAPGAFYPFDEVETRVAADARFFVIVASVGVLAGLLGWLLLRGNRGPLVLLGLGAGGLAGAALTAWVGYLSGGGTYSGKTNTIIAHLPLSLHMRGLIFVEPALSVLLYGIVTAFAVHDDLGRPDPVRRTPPPVPAPSPVVPYPGP